MNLAMVNEATVMMNEREHPFTDAEIEFIVQFAFKSGDRERTKQLIEELMGAKNEVESQQIQQSYTLMNPIKQQWVDQMENLLVALERYRLEEEKAIGKLVEFLRAYGFEVTFDELRKSEIEKAKEGIDNAVENVIENVVKNVPKNVLENAVGNVLESAVVSEEVG